eukprot:TRINITY_DN6393_c0_g1_i2.p1 TRINITY_DN6393_c0_g1~~TRINITY_DN6393_c0_g1_i2.p1  ORF type:complete len:264 (-),score=28.96 TRINITY_DN6393_c0_g1_i2:48-791(-)
MPTTLFERQRALTNFIALMTGVMLVTNFEDLANPKHGDHDQNVDELISWCDGWNSQCGDHKGNPDKNATLLFFCDDNAIDTLLYDFHNVTANVLLTYLGNLKSAYGLNLFASCGNDHWTDQGDVVSNFMSQHDFQRGYVGMLQRIQVSEKQVESCRIQGRASDGEPKQACTGIFTCVQMFLGLVIYLPTCFPQRRGGDQTSVYVWWTFCKMIFFILTSVVELLFSLAFGGLLAARYNDCYWDQQPFL